MKLLVAEDDPKLLKSLKHILETNRYVVDGVTNGHDAFTYAQTGEYDGLVLDIMMPGLDGIQVLKRLRSQGIQVPTLFLTAKTEVEQRVEGLDAGADDYLPKPFAVSELLARIRAMLRRKENYVPDLISCQDLTLNRSTYEIESGGQIQPLSAKEFQILEMLMQQPGQAVPAERLMTHIWGWESEVESSVIWVHISNLRKKLQAIHTRTSIRFVRGAGYLLG